MAYSERTQSRKLSSVTFTDDADVTKHRLHAFTRPIHYDSGSGLERADLTPERLDNLQFDGWQIEKNSFRLLLGEPRQEHPGEDGWVVIRWKDTHTLASRLLHTGYFRVTGGSPNLAAHWTHISAANPTPDYTRAGNLSFDAQTMTIEGESFVASMTAEWRNLWTTPGGGELWYGWEADTRWFKSNIFVNTEAQDWIETNAPPTTPPSQTYFGLVFQMDWADIPKRRIAGILHGADDDFNDDDGPVELLDAQDNLLAVLPVDYLYVVGHPETRLRLRKRFWQDPDGHWYMAIGALVSDIQTLPEGPWRFDPTYDEQPDSGGIDCWVQSSSPDGNFGYENNLSIQQSEGTRVLFLFDLSSIDADATVDDADVILTTDEFSFGGLTGVEVHRILAANDGWVEYASWNYALPSSQRWAGDSGSDGGADAGCGVSGTDYAATTMFSGNLSATEDVANTLAVASTSEVEAMIDANYGFICFKAASESGQYVFVSAGDNGTAADRPELIIEYSTGGGPSGSPWNAYAQQH